MHNLEDLDLPELYDLLAVYMTQYTKTLSIGIYNRDEHAGNKERMELLQKEIEKRNQQIDIEPEDEGFLDGLTPAIA